MELKIRTEIVGKRYLGIYTSEKTKFSLTRLAEWKWETGIIRAVSTKDCKSKDLHILVEYDPHNWKQRNWLKVHSDFKLFFVEKTLCLVKRKNPRDVANYVWWPALCYIPIIDAGLFKTQKEPIEFLIDRHVEVVPSDEILNFPAIDDSELLGALKKYQDVKQAVKYWVQFQENQHILLSTPMVLSGRRVSVYRTEGTTQWYSAVVKGYNNSNKCFSVISDTVLQETEVDPASTQMHLLDDGGAESVQRGGSSRRRRSRNCKESENTLVENNSCLQLSCSIPPKNSSSLPSSSRQPSVSRSLGNSTDLRSTADNPKDSSSNSTLDRATSQASTRLQRRTSSKCQTFVSNTEVENIDEKSNNTSNKENTENNQFCINVSCNNKTNSNHTSSDRDSSSHSNHINTARDIQIAKTASKTENCSHNHKVVANSRENAPIACDSALNLASVKQHSNDDETMHFKKQHLLYMDTTDQKDVALKEVTSGVNKFEDVNQSRSSPLNSSRTSLSFNHSSLSASIDVTRSVTDQIAELTKNSGAGIDRFGENPDRDPSMISPDRNDLVRTSNHIKETINSNISRHIDIDKLSHYKSVSPASCSASPITYPRHSYALTGIPYRDSDGLHKSHHVQQRRELTPSTTLQEQSFGRTASMSQSPHYPMSQSRQKIVVQPYPHSLSLPPQAAALSALEYAALQQQYVQMAQYQNSAAQLLHMTQYAPYDLLWHQKMPAMQPTSSPWALTKSQDDVRKKELSREYSENHGKGENKDRDAVTERIDPAKHDSKKADKLWKQQQSERERRILNETVQAQDAVNQHFDQSLKWVGSKGSPKVAWPSKPSITLGTGRGCSDPSKPSFNQGVPITNPAPIDYKLDRLAGDKVKQEIYGQHNRDDYIRGQPYAACMSNYPADLSDRELIHRQQIEAEKRFKNEDIIRQQLSKKDLRPHENVSPGDQSSISNDQVLRSTYGYSTPITEQYDTASNQQKVNAVVPSSKSASPCTSQSELNFSLYGYQPFQYSYIPGAKINGNRALYSPSHGPDTPSDSRTKNVAVRPGRSPTGYAATSSPQRSTTPTSKSPISYVLPSTKLPRSPYSPESKIRSIANSSYQQFQKTTKSSSDVDTVHLSPVAHKQAYYSSVYSTPGINQCVNKSSSKSSPLSTQLTNYPAYTVATNCNLVTMPMSVSSHMLTNHIIKSPPYLGQEPLDSSLGNSRKHKSQSRDSGSSSKKRKHQSNVPITHSTLHHTAGNQSAQPSNNMFPFNRTDSSSILPTPSSLDSSRDNNIAKYSQYSIEPPVSYQRHSFKDLMESTVHVAFMRDQNQSTEKVEHEGHESNNRLNQTPLNSNFTLYMDKSNLSVKNEQLSPVSSACSKNNYSPSSIYSSAPLNVEPSKSIFQSTNGVVKSTLVNSSSTSSSSLSSLSSSITETINRVANGIIDTDSDTVSVPSPQSKSDPVQFRSISNSQDRPKNFKKAWLQRHSNEDKDQNATNQISSVTLKETASQRTSFVSQNPPTVTPFQSESTNLPNKHLESTQDSSRDSVNFGDKKRKRKQKQKTKKLKLGTGENSPYGSQFINTIQEDAKDGGNTLYKHSIHSEADASDTSTNMDSELGLVDTIRRDKKHKKNRRKDIQSNESSLPANFTKPLNLHSLAELKRSCLPYIQDGPCCEVAPRLKKCRECKMTATQLSKKQPNIFCRFYAFRKLQFNEKSLTIHGFSVVNDAEKDDIEPWLPRLPIIEPKLNCETAKYIMMYLGELMCNLIRQEMQARSNAVDTGKITWKRAVVGVREMCDVCDTTLFNFHWVCYDCGFVVCIDCYNIRAQKMNGGSDIVDDIEDLDWLKCSSNRQPHDAKKLMLTQIVPANALKEIDVKVHAMRDRWGVKFTCSCSKIDGNLPCHLNGVTQLSAVCPKDKIKSLDKISEDNSSKRTRRSFAVTVNGECNEKDDSKSGGDSNSPSPLTLLADVASSKSFEGDASANGAEGSCSTLRDLLSKAAGRKRDGNKRRVRSRAVDPSPLPTNNSFDAVIKSAMSAMPTAAIGELITSAPIEVLTNYMPRLKSSLTRCTSLIPLQSLSETSIKYPDVPHSWLCDGRLLRLHDCKHPGNVQIFQEQWKRGQPVLVSGVHHRLRRDIWKPAAFSKQFGNIENDLVDTRTGISHIGFEMRKFWDGFDYLSKRLKNENDEPMLLKLKDWPSAEDFRDIMPNRFTDLMNALPLPEYTRRDGVLNLAARLPDFLVKPDLGPKMYNAYGSASYPQEGTTNLHLDISDAVNVMVYIGVPNDGPGGKAVHEAAALKAIDDAGCDETSKRRVRDLGEVPGALWHIYNAQDANKIRDFLNKVSKERGEYVELHHDPIHDQCWYLDEKLRARLKVEYGVDGYTIVQCLGDCVFIPSGAAHQVRNLHSCIKVAEDFVTPENLSHCFQMTQEFRYLSKSHTNHEDKLQVKNIVFHAIKDAIAVLTESG